MYWYFGLFPHNHASELVECVHVYFSVKKRLLVVSFQSIWHFSCSFLSVMALANRRLLLWSIIWAFSSFFVLLPVVPLFFFLFNPCPCVFLSIPDVSSQTPCVCSYLLSVLPSLLSSMQRLSLWQTCAITKTLWIIARLSIKGVIFPQWPTPWREWAHRRQCPPCPPCPAVPAPSVTSMIVFSARPVKRQLKDSR